MKVKFDALLDEVREQDEVSKLDDIKNVNITSVTNGQVIKWDAANFKWVNADDIDTNSYKSKVSSADTTENYLESKIVAGSNITITKLNTGANETLSIASSSSPGGADTNVQFNDGGVFGGESTFTFNKTTKEVGVNTLRAININPTSYNFFLVGSGPANTATITTGIHNYGIGTSSLSSVTEADYNLAFGYQALMNLEDGAFNLAIGYQSGLNSTGDFNTLLGTAAGSSAWTNTGNNYCTFIGYASGLSFSGNNNLAIGSECCKAIGGYECTGSGNAMFGYRTGYAIKSTASNNVAIGSLTMYQVSGDNNIAFGSNAANGITTGGNNFVAGYYAGQQGIGAGFSNILIGYQSGRYMSGTDNFLFGAYAGVNFSGDYNLMLGSYVASNLEGSYNLMMGYQNSRYSNHVNGTSLGNISLGSFATTYLDGGDYNTVLGYSAGYRITNGGDNILIGAYSGTQLTTQSNCVAIGSSALQESTGQENQGIGTNAGYSVTGSYNNIWGFRAMSSTVGGSYNIVMGYTAGRELVGDSNVLIGKDSGYYLKGSYNTFLGFTSGTWTSNAGLQTYNVGIGFSSFRVGVGDINTFVGKESGERCEGINNVGMGERAGGGWVGFPFLGDHNISMGTKSAMLLNGDNNISLGQKAGYVVKGDNNITAGENTGSYITGDNNILLGKNVYSTARTVSNTLAIDYSDTTTPLIYGEFDNRIVKIHGDLKLPSSGKKLFLGVSDNTSIGYDGTDLNIKSGLVAPSDLVIDCGTEKTLELTETVWDDWQGQLSSNQKVNPSAHIVDNNTEASVIFTTNCDTGDYIYMSPQMQHSWKLGSDIHPHLHWIQTTASQPNWLIQYRWQRNGQTKTTAWTDYALDTSVFTWVTGALLQITEGATKITPPTGYGISDIVQFRIIRDVNNDSGAFVGAETNSVDTESVSFDYHFQIDTLGSRTEFTK